MPASEEKGRSRRLLGLWAFGVIVAIAGSGAVLVTFSLPLKTERPPTHELVTVDLTVSDFLVETYENV